MATTRSFHAAAAPRCRRAARAPLPPRAVFGGDKGAVAPAAIKRWPEEVAPAGVCVFHTTLQRLGSRCGAYAARCDAGGAAAGEAHQEAAALRCVSRARARKAPLELTAPRLCCRVSEGFVDQAETINSRAAMIGFFALLLVEAVRDLCG